jgi:segregation and condensation protein B
MARSPEPPSDRAVPVAGLPALEAPAESSGLALDQLSAALAGMLGKGDDPYAAAPEPQPQTEAEPGLDESAAHQACEITPRSILEAMLFVGSPTNEPLSSRQVAALMRGVRPAEIDSLVGALNAEYERRNCPYTIFEQAGGYRLALRPEFDRLRDKFYGRTRQARLSQAAIEVLAAVAYHEPVTAEEINKLRGTVSGHVLAQLVRRQLVRLERNEANPRRPVYWTTERFLELFGLSSLGDLPRSGELEQPASAPSK